MIVRDMKVKVLLSLDEVDDKNLEISSYKFSSDSGDPDGYVQEDGTLDFSSLHERVDVEFEVTDNVKGKDFSFPKRGRDAVWLEDGGICPTGKGEAGGKVRIKKDENDKMNLVIRNFNENREDLGYVLRFKDRVSSQTYKLDPVIRNGGGGRRVD